MAALSLGKLNPYRQQPWQGFRAERHETMVLLPAQRHEDLVAIGTGDRSCGILPGHPHEAVVFHHVGAVPSPMLADVLDLAPKTAFGGRPWPTP
jgi:hypothetical protein